MAIIDVTGEWSEPLTLSGKSIVAVNNGTLIMAFGSDAPSGERDGIPARGGFLAVFEEGTVIRFRTPNAAKTAEVYVGPLA